MMQWTDPPETQRDCADAFKAADRLKAVGMPVGYPDGSLRPLEPVQGARLIFAMDKLVHFTLQALDAGLQDLYARIARCTVQIDRSDGGTGAGALISPTGLVATVNHVVEGDRGLMVRWAGGPLAGQDTRAFLNVVAVDKARDLALCRILTGAHVGVQGPFEYLELGDEAELDVGQVLAVVGSPLGLTGRPAACLFGGIRRGGPFGEYVDLVGPINPGNSGGPTVTTSARLVGLVDWKLVHEAVEGVAAAAPVSAFKQLMADVLEQRLIEPWEVAP